MKKPILTLAIASWGIEEWMLKKNLESISEALDIIPQEDIEVIFMDDRDPKESYLKAEKQFSKYQNAVVIRNDENLKLSKGRIILTQQAKGEYFHRVDADDWVDPQKLKKFVEYLSTSNHDLLINGYMEQGREKKFTNKIRNPRGRTPLFTANVTYKTELIRKLPEPKFITNLAEDAWLIIQSLIVANSYIHTKFTWYNYRGKGTSGADDFIANIENFERTTKELTEIKFKSRKNYKKVRTLRIAEHTLMRILVGLVYFRSIANKTTVRSERKYVVENLIKPNKDLYYAYRKDWYHNNLFKFTFSFFTLPLQWLIKLIIKREASKTKEKLNKREK